MAADADGDGKSCVSGLYGHNIYTTVVCQTSMVTMELVALVWCEMVSVTTNKSTTVQITVLGYDFRDSLSVHLIVRGKSKECNSWLVTIL